METNILKALIHINQHPENDIQELYIGKNRANSQGDALEKFVKDAFCNSFEIDDKDEISQLYNQYFSYQGSQNNPPDIIIKNGDAIEVKKMESFNSNIQLNSSYPKNKLYRDDPKINLKCKNVEGGNWETKDIIYVLGYVNDDKKLQHLHFVYGDVYAANREVYLEVFNRAKEAIDNGFDESELTPTKEIGVISKTDALGSAFLRVRPMWMWKHPVRLIEELNDIKKNDGFLVTALIRKEKYDTLDFKEEFEDMINSNERFLMNVKELPDPSNPEQTIDVVVIRMNFYD